MTEEIKHAKEYNANLKTRAKILRDVQKDPQIKDAVIKGCVMDPIFFIDLFCWTYDPRLDDPHRPFITYPYQATYIRDLIDCIEQGRDSCTEKSRDMGFSWMLVVICIWGMLFRQWSSLYGSYKETYVDKQGDMDSFFERVRYVIGRLPEWLKPADLKDKYMGISSKEFGSEISGDSGENFGTGGRRKFVILDEFALWVNAEKAFRKTKDVANCRIFGGTPEGRYNVYGKIMTHHEDYEHLDIKRFRLHWTMHPGKTQDWYEEEKRKRLKLDVAKELDISYDDSVTGAVYKDFSSVVRFGRYKFNPKLKLYTAWDFGRDMTAIIWFQKDFETDEIFIIDAYQKKDKDIDFFIPFVTGEIEATPESGAKGVAPEGVYDEDELDMIKVHAGWRGAYANHFGDPYNIDNRSVLGENTIRKQLQSYGIYVQSKRTSGGKTGAVQERIHKTALAMRRMKIREDLHDFIQAIIQSRYPQVKEGSEGTSEKRLPVHDVNSHFRTALEYGMDNEPMGMARRKRKGNVEAARAYAERVAGIVLN